MIKTIKFAFKKLPGCMLLALALIISVSVVYAPRSLAATGNLCYDYNSGTLFHCLDFTSNPDGTPVSDETKVDGGGTFNKADCYTLNNVDTGWQVADCSDNVFSGTVTTPITTTQDSATSGCDGNVCGLSIFTKDINPILTFLSAGVGVIVTIMVVVGAIQFSASGGNPQAAAAAKKRITNALLALVAYGLMYGLLQWIVPGGIFN